MRPERELDDAPSTDLREAPEPAGVPASVPAGLALSFRVGVVFWIAYWAPFWLSVLPRTDVVGDTWLRVWAAPARAFGHRVLGIAQPLDVLATTGSGDRAIDWLLLGQTLLVAALGALVWTAMDRRPAPRLAAFLRSQLRWALGLTLVSYGLAKWGRWPQFPAPGPGQLVEPFGQMSPMGVLWSFMGTSRPYCIFAGALEAGAGLLLLARRTAVVGALLASAVLANIVALNLCYDVPVKQASSVYLLGTLVLLVPHTRRLWGALVVGAGAGAAEPEPDWLAPRWRRLRSVAAVLLLAAVVVPELLGGGPGRPTTPLDGVWRIAAGTGDVGPDAAVPELRWRSAGLGGFLRVVHQNDTVENFRVTHEPALRELRLWERSPTGAELARLSYVLEGDVLRLEGTIRGHPVRFRAERDARPMPLATRGFHWVSEAPFNR